MEHGGAIYFDDLAIKRVEFPPLVMTSQFAIWNMMNMAMEVMDKNQVNQYKSGKSSTLRVNFPYCVR